MDFNKYATKFCINNDEYEEKMKRIFSFYYPQENKLSNEQKQALDDILENTELIKNALIPLKKLGLDFSLSLVGGAVREFSLDKSNQINDYDFVLNLESAYSFEKIISREKLNDIFSQEELNSIYRELIDVEEQVRKSYEDDVEHIYFSITDKDIKKEAYKKLIWSKLVEKQVKSTWKKYNFFKNKDVENEYLNKHIQGIFQFNGINGKKIDLILSEYDGFAFTSTFDFEICKAEINLSFLLKDEPFEGNKVKELLGNTWLTPGMLRDLDDKTLSIRVDNFDVKHIHYFMNKHFLKLKEKFPGYSLNYFEKKNFDGKPEKKEEIAVLNYYKLQHEMPLNENVNQRQRVKI